MFLELGLLLPWPNAGEMSVVALTCGQENPGNI